MEVEGRGSRKKGVGGSERGSRRERAKKVWKERVGGMPIAESRVEVGGREEVRKME